MDKFDNSDLMGLTGVHDGPCVTICMPTHGAGAEGQQDSVRLKNLADQVERQLAADWLRGADARDFVAPIRALPIEHDFWEKRGQGLALFVDRTSLRRFRVPIRLNELALVNRRFHVKPLLPLLTGGDNFFILALSQHQVRLFKAREHQIEQMDVSSMPPRIGEALNLIGADRGSQSHFAMTGGKGKESSVFHGQGGERETHKDELSLYFRLIDEALAPVLRNETAPLVLAGVDYLLPIFRKTSCYPHLAAQQLAGNCDHLSARQIHEKVWPLVKPLLIKGRERTAAKYRRLAGTGKTADDIRQALPAAFAGRIETLFVASDRHVWGTCDADGQVIDEHGDQRPGDDDLLDAAAVQTLLHGGNVHAVESSQMPAAEAVAAVMRF